MESYYQLLGLEAGGDPKDVKRAYFKAIRKYSPDKEPEMFKKVREAYEVLSDEKKREEYDLVSGMEPFFQKAYRHALMLKENNDYEGAAACCEEMLSAASLEPFQFLLGTVYLLNGNAGKAVKRFEELSKKAPGNRRYLKSLLEAYYARDWKKKAIAVCEKLEAAGCRDTDFFLLYAVLLSGQGKYKAAKEYMQNAVNSLPAGVIDSLEMVENSWRALFEKAVEIPGGFLNECLEAFIKFKKTYGGSQKDLAETTLGLVMFLQIPETEKQVHVDQTLYSELVGLLKEYGESDWLPPEHLMIIEMAVRKQESIILQHDERISGEILTYADVIYAYGACKAMEKRFGDSVGRDVPWELEPEIEAACLEARLLIAGSLPGIKKSIQIMKEEYPYYKEAMEGFLEEALTCTSRAFLINKYEKKLKKSPTGMDNPFWDGSDEGYDIFSQAEPYRRNTPKIGRNQPCPCGSGKKYKNCCGR